jgi:hypothetical protein
MEETLVSGILQIQRVVIQALQDVDQLIQQPVHHLL